MAGWCSPFPTFLPPLLLFLPPPRAPVASKSKCLPSRDLSFVRPACGEDITEVAEHGRMRPTRRDGDWLGTRGNGLSVPEAVLRGGYGAHWPRGRGVREDKAINLQKLLSAWCILFGAASRPIPLPLTPASISASREFTALHAHLIAQRACTGYGPANWPFVLSPQTQMRPSSAEQSEWRRKRDEGRDRGAREVREPSVHRSHVAKIAIALAATTVPVTTGALLTGENKGVRAARSHRHRQSPLVGHVGDIRQYKGCVIPLVAWAEA